MSRFLLPITALIGVAHVILLSLPASAFPTSNTTVWVLCNLLVSKKSFKTSAPSLTRTSHSSYNLLLIRPTFSFISCSPTITLRTENPPPNLLRSTLWWKANKSLHHDVNQDYTHELTLFIDGLVVGILKFDASGFTSHCDRNRVWCATHGDPQDPTIYFWYKGYRYRGVTRTQSCFDEKYHWCLLYTDFNSPF